MKPTAEQWEELLRWCGFEYRPNWERCWKYPTKYPHSQSSKTPPKLTLDNLFRWAIPLAIDKIMAEHECSSDIAYAILFKHWLEELQLDIPHAANTLFLVVYLVMKEAKTENEQLKEALKHRLWLTDWIYNSLKAIEAEESIRLSDRAFIADHLAPKLQALWPDKEVV